MTHKNPQYPAPVVGQYYQWEGPTTTFYMGRCTSVVGASVTFGEGPKMLDDGRYKVTSPAYNYRTVRTYEGQEVRT